MYGIKSCDYRIFGYVFCVTIHEECSNYVRLGGVDFTPGIQHICYSSIIYLIFNLLWRHRNNALDMSVDYHLRVRF